MRLRRNQFCPIHHSRCGREAIPKQTVARQMGVRRIEDPHHPRGYRELRSNSEMRKLMTASSRSSMGNARSARRNSLTTPMWSRNTSTPAASAAHGETITPTTSRLSTGGVTTQRDRADGERTNRKRSIVAWHGVNRSKLYCLRGIAW
jgi:hypothetical protein